MLCPAEERRFPDAVRTSGFAPGGAGKTHRWRHLGPGTNCRVLGKGGEEGELWKRRAPGLSHWLWQLFGAFPVSIDSIDSGNDTLLNPFGICYGWLALALSSVFWISSGSSSLHLFLKIRMISSLWQHTLQSVSERLSKLHQSTRCVQIPSGWHWQVDEILAKDVEAKPSNLGTFIDFSEPGFEELVVHQSNGVLGCYRGQWVGLTAFQAEVENIDNFDKYVN